MLRKFKVMIDLRQSIAPSGNVLIIEKPVELFGIGAMKTQPVRCARPKADQAAFKMTLQVEHDIEPLRANLFQERPYGAHQGTSIEQNHFVDRGAVLQ